TFTPDPFIIQEVITGRNVWIHEPDRFSLRLFQLKQKMLSFSLSENINVSLADRQQGIVHTHLHLRSFHTFFLREVHRFFLNRSTAPYKPLERCREQGRICSND